MQTTTTHRRVAMMLVASIVVAGLQNVALAVSSIPTGNVDLTGLASTAPTLGVVDLVKWRQPGTANAAPVVVSAMTFDYFKGRTGVALPKRSNVADATANDNSAIWSDNALRVNFTRGNAPNYAILVYTANPNTKPGIVSQSGISTLPMLWKAIPLTDIKAVSGVAYTGTTPTTGAGSIIRMSQEITNTTGGNCPADAPYAASTRNSNGFCDYSTHFFMDKNSSAWYTNLTGTPQQKAFNYASLVGPSGVNANEDGSGGGDNTSPMFAALGLETANAIPDIYSTTMYVELLNY